jgi:hypothetical protein
MCVLAICHYNSMKTSVLALLSVAAFAANLRQGFLGPQELVSQVFNEAHSRIVKPLELRILSTLYPDKAEQVLGELEACAKDAVEEVKEDYATVYADLKAFAAGCAAGSTDDAVDALVGDTLQSMASVAAGCEGMSVDIVGDIEQVIAAMIVKQYQNSLLLTGKFDDWAASKTTELKDWATTMAAELEKFNAEFAQSAIGAQVAKAASEAQHFAEQTAAAAKPYVEKAATATAEYAKQAAAAVSPYATQAVATVKDYAKQAIAAEEQIAEQLVSASGVSPATISEAEGHVEELGQAFVKIAQDAQAGTLTPEELVSTLNDAKKLMNDSGAAYADVANTAAAYAVPAIDSMCAFVQPLLKFAI